MRGIAVPQSATQEFDCFTESEWESAIPEQLERAKRFRVSAERLRADAEQSASEEDRAKSLAVARHYEKMADELERAAGKDGVLSTK